MEEYGLLKVELSDTIPLTEFVYATLSISDLYFYHL